MICQSRSGPGRQHASILRSCVLHRAYALVKPSTCWANVLAVQDVLLQKNRRIRKNKDHRYPATSRCAVCGCMIGVGRLLPAPRQGQCPTVTRAYSVAVAHPVGPETQP